MTSNDLMTGPAPGTGGDGAVLSPAPKSPRALSLVTGNLRQSGIYIAFVAIVALFTVLTDGVLLSPGNLTNLVLQYSYILVLAIGMVIVIIAGHIDLSVGSVVAFVGGLCAIMMSQWDLPWLLAVVLSLGVGALVGMWQGFWVAYVGIPAFIVTLAGMLIFRGLAIVLVGTTIQALTQRSREEFRLSRWRSRVRDHIVVVGYGAKGRNAIRELVNKGHPQDRVVRHIEVGARGAHDRGRARLHRTAERAAHLAAMREAQVDDRVGRGKPGEEVGVGDVGMHAQPGACPRRLDDRLDVVPLGARRVGVRLLHRGRRGVPPGRHSPAPRREPGGLLTRAHRGALPRRRDRGGADRGGRGHASPAPRPAAHPTLKVRSPRGVTVRSTISSTRA